MKWEQDLHVLADIGLSISAPAWEPRFPEAQAQIRQLARTSERTRADAEVRSHQT